MLNTFFLLLTTFSYSDLKDFLDWSVFMSYVTVESQNTCQIGQGRCYSHFRDEETEVQESTVTYLVSQSRARYVHVWLCFWSLQ